ncbi:hypothetical protein VP01_2002g4 [Puccinia sorghi]|uniref:Uncharacterized protein n=1 Tax=Puccinia sorghi TaxID=27349 RepID=A0A0L6VD82_9BASI|nr:hypothetical protein VP01_2002g4 [Puccinia sorghi]
MIGASGNPLHSNQITIESLNIFWYRIVLDEADQNPNAKKTDIQKHQTKHMLCLNGMPFQN